MLGCCVKMPCYVEGAGHDVRRGCGLDNLTFSERACERARKQEAGRSEAFASLIFESLRTVCGDALKSMHKSRMIADRSLLRVDAEI